MKKKTIAIFVSCAFFMIAVFSLASAATNGQPFNALQDSLNKLQAQVDKLSQNSNTGGVHQKVYTGTFPSSIPNPLSADDKVVAVEIDMGNGETAIDHEYYKAVTIPEIDTSEMPQVSMYLKDTNEDRNAILGDDIWESYYDSGTILVKDGIVYLKYGYGIDGAQVNYEVAGKEYKIVVVY